MRLLIERTMAKPRLSCLRLDCAPRGNAFATLPKAYRRCD